MQNDFDIRFLFSIFLRRFPIFILTAVLCFGAAAGVAVVLPPVYKASATMLVISQQIPSALAQSTVTVDAVERIKVIEKQLMVRDTLLAIEEDFQVFPQRASMSPSTVVEAMRKSTRFEQARLGATRRGGGGALAFTISFSANSAQVAARVTNEFVTRILERNVQLRTTTAAGTSEFFEQQVARLEAELTKLELDIVSFKRENAGKLPETLNYRRDRLGLLTQARQLQQRERASLLNQRELLVAAISSQTKPEAQMTPEEKTLAEVRRARALRRAILSENHPEIRALDSRIAALEGLVEEQRAAAEKAVAEGAVPAPTTPMERERAMIDKRVEELDSQIAELSTEIDQLASSIAETPNIEMALRTLNREYDGLREEFAAARAKLASAATGEQLELKQQAERFEVVEQATLPERPISPNRPMILMAGAVGGVGAGLGFIILLELMNKTIRRPSELARIDITPIAIVPYIYTAKEMRNRKMLRISIILGFVLLVAVGSYVVHYYYMPLDLLLERLIQRARIDDAIKLVRTRLNF
ncbi:GumC family protein [Rhodovulum sp. DZ06]|uniref:GumC family protein n=1 Tax=Rhodovulum sp. DZ06 TaxID=3425126 RepID=UPI003D3553CF